LTHEQVEGSCHFLRLAQLTFVRCSALFLSFEIGGEVAIRF
jgi:hypothetical protein